MDKKSKLEYLLKINKEYNYDKSVIDTMASYEIYDKEKLDKISKITTEYKNDLLLLMEIVTDFLDNYQIVHWVDGGTLLGAMRNNKMIEWDDDVDLAIPMDSFIKLGELIKKYKKRDNMYQLQYNIYKLNFIIIKSKDPIIRDKPLMMKVYFQDKPVFIDLILYIPYYNNEYITNFKYWRKFYVYKFSDIYPLKKIEFENKKYWCVNKPHKYLDNAYWFWKHLGLASHCHDNPELEKDRNKKIYYIL